MGLAARIAWLSMQIWVRLNRCHQMRAHGGADEPQMDEEMGVPLVEIFGDGDDDEIEAPVVMQQQQQIDPNNAMVVVHPIPIV